MARSNLTSVRKYYLRGNRRICKATMNEDMEKFLLEELTCPSCYNYMSPPIKQCQKGHNFCYECFPKVTVCPKCRAPKNISSRNYALEAIHDKLKIPCKNQYLGCKYICLGESIKKHQKYCLYTKKHCPFAQYDSCQWKDSVTRLKSHLQKKHSHNFYQKERQKFISQHFKNIRSYHYIFAVINVYDAFFRLTWEIEENTEMTRWAVYYMGSPEDAARFSYKLEFTKGHHIVSTGVPLTFKSICDAKPERDIAKFGDHDCFYIHKNLLDRYCSENGDLHYRVSIYVEEEDEYTSDIALLFVER